MPRSRPPGLTVKQARVLAFIRGRIAAGLPPSVREICGRFGWSGANAAVSHLVALERKGAIMPRAVSARYSGRGHESRGLRLAPSRPGCVDMSSGSPATDSTGGAGVAYRIGGHDAA